MDAWVIVSAAGSAAGGAAASATVLRGWWSRREIRQQRAFRAAVQAIVDESAADLIGRQAQAEARQGRHLDRQDKKLDALAAEVRRWRGTSGG